MTMEIAVDETHGINRAGISLFAVLAEVETAEFRSPTFWWKSSQISKAERRLIAGPWFNRYRSYWVV